MENRQPKVMGLWESAKLNSWLSRPVSQRVIICLKNNDINTGKYAQWAKIGYINLFFWWPSEYVVLEAGEVVLIASGVWSVFSSLCCVLWFRASGSNIRGESWAATQKFFIECSGEFQDSRPVIIHYICTPIFSCISKAIFLLNNSHRHQKYECSQYTLADSHHVKYCITADPLGCYFVFFFMDLQLCSCWNNNFAFRSNSNSQYEATSLFSI